MRLACARSRRDAVLGGVALRLSASIRPRACDFGFGCGLAAELHQSQPLPSGSSARPSELMPLRARVVDEEIVEAFEADGLVLHDFGDVVGALIDVGIGDDQQDALRRTLDQAAGCFENRDAGAFGADQCAGDVEAVFGEQVVQVVAGDAARDVGELLADQIAVCVGDLFQGGVDVVGAVRVARPDEPGPLARGRPPT